METLTLAGQPLAEYVVEPDIDPVRGPRPYLHPVRTLAGTVVTDVLPEDHPHHLGVSVAMQDVNRTNLWGGRTYVRGTGYTWLDDHATIAHTGWLRREDGLLANRMVWHAHDGTVLLTEDRTMTARAVDSDPRAWRFDLSFTLTNTHDEAVSLGSPATNGRPDKAGYGGFFWRAAPGATRVFDPYTDVESDVNGSVAPWVALAGVDYTLVFSGLADDDRWFVRATEYPGVCAALAFEHPLVLKPTDTLTRHYTVLVCDGARTPTTLPLP